MSRRSYKRIPSKGGRVLRFMRQKSGLSLRAVAARVGISSCMICHIELGREDLPKGRLESLVVAYGYSLADFEGYMQGRKIAINYRDGCIEMVRALDLAKLKSVHALMSSFG